MAKDEVKMKTKFNDMFSNVWSVVRMVGGGLTFLVIMYIGIIFILSFIFPGLKQYLTFGELKSISLVVIVISISFLIIIFTLVFLSKCINWTAEIFSKLIAKIKARKNKAKVANGNVEIKAGESTKERGINESIARNIVADYGDYMQKYACYVTSGKPGYLLPYSKNKIKEAIKYLLLANVKIKGLVTGYCELAYCLNNKDFEDIKDVSFYYERMLKIRKGEESKFYEKNKFPVLNGKQKKILNKMRRDYGKLFDEISIFMEKSNIKN